MLYVFLAVSLIASVSLTYVSCQFASYSAIWQIPVFFIGSFLALVLLFAGRLVYDYAPYSAANQRLLTFLLTTAILSLGLGLFNLIPIPPLDGSKVLFSLLPDRAYNMMLRYERYGMLLLWAVVLLGVGDRWMSAAIQWTYELFCRVVGF